ncbi:MAG: hypothetical protein ABII79_08755 [bacterium]
MTEFGPVRSWLMALLATAILVLTLGYTSTEAATTTITSLPYTASQAGSNFSETLLVAGTNLSTGGSGINVTGHDIVIYLVNDTITFGTDNGDSHYGIRLYYSAYNIRIIGGTIYHGGTGDRNVCLKPVGVNDVLIDGTNMRVAGSNGHCLYCPSVGEPGNYNVEVSGGHYRSDVTGYSSRCNYDAAAIWLGSTYAGEGDYHYKAHGLKLITGPSQGLIVSGRDGGNEALVFVYECSLQSDARNDFYTSGDITCRSAANPYQIMGNRLAGGSEIHDNVITSGTNYGGSRGMIFEMCSGTPENPVKIFNNHVDVHEGPNLEVPQGNVQVLRIRFGNKYLHVYDNVFIGRGSTGLGSSYGNQVSCMRITATDEEGHVPDHGIVVERNLFRAEALSDGVNALAGVFEGFADIGNIFRYNRFESSGDIICFGENNHGAHGVMLYADTLVRLSPSYDPRTVVVGWRNYFHATADTLRDCVYLGGASDGNIVFDEDRSDYRLERTLSIRVNGNNSLPVPQTQVTVVDAYGHTVLNGVTNSLGVVSGPASYRWEQHTGDDSMSYNDFAVKAKKGSDSTLLTIIVSAGSASPTLVLTNTAGEEPSEDTTPPGAINSLDAVPGTLTGQIELTWTAPGDDGYSGTASRYDIRYSLSPINETNWSAATAAANPPSPSPAGSTESFTLTGLQKGRIYYVAIKTFDDADLVSGLSNVAQAYAGGIVAPTVTGTTVNESSGLVTTECSTVSSYLPLTYEFALDTVVTFPDARLATGEVSGSTVSTSFDNLTNGATYYWRCRAVVVAGSHQSDWSSIVTFVLSEGNNPPGPPTHLSPLDGDTATAEPIVLWVTNAIDIDDDILTYDFWISSEASFATVLDSAMNVSAGASQTSAIINGLQPQDGQRYYWRCRAGDGTTYSSVTTPTSFVWVSLSTGEDEYITSLSKPADGALVLTDRPTLATANVDDTRDNYYTFQVATDAGFSNVVITSDTISERANGVTKWKIPDPLQAGRTYYWRARADDYDYSAVSSFTVDVRIFASPNPVYFRRGQVVTFHMPETAVDLLIQTISGEMVRLERELTGDWAWSGTNSAGLPVATGIYLWYVPGTSHKGKIVVKP